MDILSSGPKYLNLEYIFFLIYRLFAGIGTFFRSLFGGLRGDNSNSRLRKIYESQGGTQSNCNPFLGDVCSSSSSDSGGGVLGGMLGDGTFDSVTALGVGLRIFLILLFLILLFIIVYSFLQWRSVKKQSDYNIVKMIPEAEAHSIQNDRWLRIKELIASQSESDWRVAILEADTMLEDMVAAMNLPGDNLGERLKAVEPSDFLTLQQAWEAHKVRNQIAHEGSNFILDHRKALLTIRLFEEVFNEFKII